ncbi:MAG: cytochrome-c oxidase, cbb3-type subunit III [Stagnimonas sp.]|nr:cytochrome-c oxidase, cbb3-type subunit III [Stagnimonas sp.]
MSTFWHWFIAAIAVGSIIGCLVLLFGNARGTPGEGTTGHVWDDDLREYNNPLPRWWLNLFILTIVFGVGYLIYYPGLGGFTGSSGWTQKKQLEQRMAEVQAKRQAVYARLGDRDIAALAQDPAVRSLGREVFLGNCAGCHGADAQGARGFPNLADRDWIYGGTPEAILASITQGRQGQMPPFSAALDAKAADELIDTVQHWADPAFNPARRATAMQQFALTCAACHGADGRGNALIGAPNLTDKVWLHGGSREAIRETVLFGRRSNMPAHKDILSADDIRVVAGYVYGLAPPAP